MPFLRHFLPKNRIDLSGRGHTRGPILLICNTDRDFYHIRSHTKFGWASSIIFWVMVATDRHTHTHTHTHRQTDRQTDRQTHRRHAKNTFFWIQWPSKREHSSKSGSRFFGQMQYFLYTSYSRESKNLFRKTAQYFRHTTYLRSHYNSIMVQDIEKYYII